MNRVGEMSVAERRGEAPEFDGAFRARLYDLLKWRRDVRRFKRTPLPPGTIERLIGLACLSPSVGLSEPWRFVVVEASRTELRVQVRPDGRPRPNRNYRVRCEHLSNREDQRERHYVVAWTTGGNP